MLVNPYSISTNSEMSQTQLGGIMTRPNFATNQLYLALIASLLAQKQGSNSLNKRQNHQNLRRLLLRAQRPELTDRASNLKLLTKIFNPISSSHLKLLEKEKNPILGLSNPLIQILKIQDARTRQIYSNLMNSFNQQQMNPYSMSFPSNYGQYFPQFSQISPPQIFPPYYQKNFSPGSEYYLPQQQMNYYPRTIPTFVPPHYVQHPPSQNQDQKSTQKTSLQHSTQTVTASIPGTQNAQIQPQTNDPKPQEKPLKDPKVLVQQTLNSKKIPRQMDKPKVLPRRKQRRPVEEEEEEEEE